ncbi:hypothetical protein B5M09_002564 [Aphanomyces astaci]|uniref:Uncharacterized protein n=1 Tax=Aphanomyces astaci TaxID=112090 RepID=A0A3R7WJ57_APHAT|nr:hypothetical protein B5M09_002564 [Aphanomyces astaci]
MFVSTALPAKGGAAISMQSLLNPSNEFSPAIKEDPSRASRSFPPTQLNMLAPRLSSSSNLPPKTENRASSDRKRRHEKAKARYNEEMADLQDKYDSLELQLHDLNLNKRQKIEGQAQSTWEGFARRQAWQRQQSMIENTRLKSRLEMQMSIIRDLQGVLTNQPLLLESSILGPSDIPYVHLTVDPRERKLAVDAIMQNQLARMQDVFAENGMLRTQNTWKQVSVRFDECSKELVFEMSLSFIFNVPIGDLTSGLNTVVTPRVDYSEYSNGYTSQQLQELIQATANSSTRPPEPIMTHLLSPALTSLLFADQTATRTDPAPPLGHADLVAQLSQLQEDACNTRTAELESALDALKEINRTISAQNTVLSDRNLELEAVDTARANLAPTDVVTVGHLPEAPNMAAISNDYVPSSALVDTLTRKLVEMKMHVHFVTEYTKSILDHEPYEIVHQLTQLKLDNERLRERQQNLLKEVEYYKMIWQRSAPTTKRDNNQQPLFTATTSFTPSHITLPADGGTTQHSLFKAASFSGVVPVEPLSLMALKRSSNRKIVKPQSPKTGGCMHLPHTNSPIIIHANQVR